MKDVELDWQKRAEAAMKLAVAADGLERLKWVRLAQAWQDLGRDRTGEAADRADVEPTRRPR
jgi:hypothetical protein